MQLDSEIISTTTGYFERIGIEERQIDWDETNDPKYLISFKEVNIISEIISLQISFWCLRRLGNCCQSNSDTLRRILNKKIGEYQRTFGKEYQNFNENLIW